MNLLGFPLGDFDSEIRNDEENNGWGNPGRDIYGNPTDVDVFGNRNDHNIHGNRPTDIWGNNQKDSWGNEI